LATKKPSQSGRDIVKAYDYARQQERKLGHEFSAKEFLDIVAPSARGRSETSAERYIRKLRTGERTGTKLTARARADAGRRVNVSFVDENDGFVSSANVVIPYGGSRLDIFRPSNYNKKKSRLRATAERYFRREYPKRATNNLRVLGVRSVKRTPHGAEVVR
jgi:hypothetical protein